MFVEVTLEQKGGRGGYSIKREKEREHTHKKDRESKAIRLIPKKKRKKKCRRKEKRRKKKRIKKPDSL